MLKILRKKILKTIPVWFIVLALTSGTVLTSSAYMWWTFLPDHPWEAQYYAGAGSPPDGYYDSDMNPIPNAQYFDEMPVGSFYYDVANNEMWLKWGPDFQFEKLAPSSYSLSFNLLISSKF